MLWTGETWCCLLVIIHKVIYVLQKYLPASGMLSMSDICVNTVHSDKILPLPHILNLTSSNQNCSLHSSLLLTQ